MFVFAVMISLALTCAQSAPQVPVTTFEVGKQKTMICALCQSVMQSVESNLQQNSTQDEIISALDRGCAFLPEAERIPCKSLLPLLTNYVIDIINKKLPPKKVCTLIKICVDDELSVNLQVKSGPECILCEFIMEELDKILGENATQQEIEQALEEVCSLLPSTLTSECNQFIEQYAPMLIDLLTKFPPSEVCGKLGLCSSQGKVKQALKSGPSCLICEYIMQQLDSILAEKATQQEIEQALEKVCSLLPSTLTSECNQFIEMYAPELIDLLTKFPPSEVCGKLGLCSSPGKVSKQLPSHAVGNSTLCALCEMILETLDRFLSQNATEAEIEKALEIVCFLLPGTLKTDCDHFIVQYTPLIIKLLLEETRPRQVCIAAGICPNNATKVLPSHSGSVQPSHSGSAQPSYSGSVQPSYTGPVQPSYTGSVQAVIKPAVVKDSPLCAVCELVITELENLLTANASVAEIEIALNKVCEILPSGIKDQCKSLVEEYAPGIIQLLIKKIQPAQICKALKLCSSYDSILGSLIAMQPPKENDAECFLCKLLVGKLKSMLADHTTEAEIQAALEQVCHLFPSSSQEKCKKIVDQYGSLIIQLLLSAITPDQICKEIKLCAETLRVSKDSIEGCTLCEFLMEEVQGLMKQPFIEKSAEEVFDKLCDKAPATWRAACKDLVAMYTPNIIYYLSEGINPKSFCQLIDLCEKRKEVTSQKLQPLMFVSEKKAQAVAATSIKDYCSQCKLSLVKVGSVLTNPFWERESRNVLYKLCTKQAYNNQDVCKELVDSSVDSVIYNMRIYQLPNDFCQKSDICKDSGATKCTVCNVLTKVVHSFIKEKKTITQARTLLVQTCNLIVPGGLKFQCSSLVDEYTSALLSQTSHISDPSKICEVVSFCGKS